MNAQAWVTLVVGVLAVVGVAMTVRQRTVADRRAQAWQRIAWCLDHTVGDKPVEVELGWDIYGTVTESPLVTNTEKGLLKVIAERAALALADGVETEDTRIENDREGSLDDNS
ncbi:hypothetical protein R4172_04515 [Rhodococcus kroppenstedtii]|uniref:Uncharacterized protein n=1 Tax=Rhodococcoides kroppenstedtii TaxID=293050 RepID=A0ABS7NWT5_9NOCA|nr:hypothetical protein [Rhodococcus kroppenstedtii]AMY19944.1 hypothetical protein A3Q40_02575 [Rhodococcus sp. PBTS 1]MBY6314691.1 hypothetical protein [Rhodococcus kroppenstedtii]MBY6322498.1 hypothetical protein [Rhodococcus kroppenstedtii]MBY6401302.1 hypothetical protein [Rhodococcus kroppenstedtii]MDV7196823.1 hypothetical protein [Rhodococcus kroppenstedtii]